jgi:hypothetical protein
MRFMVKDGRLLAASLVFGLTLSTWLSRPVRADECDAGNPASCDPQDLYEFCEEWCPECWPEADLGYCINECMVFLTRCYCSSEPDCTWPPK